jgi:hypothetical protein
LIWGDPREQSKIVLPVSISRDSILSIENCCEREFRREETMTVQVKRASLDFVVHGYDSSDPEVEIVTGAEGSPELVEWEKGKECSLRCFLSLQGENAPLPAAVDASTPVKPAVYRYDWAFGLTLIKGYYWDWMNEFPDNGALAIHLVLQPLPFEGGPEALPVAAALSLLHPSRNNDSRWAQMMPMLLRGGAEMAKIGSAALPALDYLSSGMTLGSDLVESSASNSKKWFLYQFFDETLSAPVVEWRINKETLLEYGPLLRGTLVLAFPKLVQAGSGALRILLRPQIHYYKCDEICYIVPTNKMPSDDQVYIDVRPA